MRRRQRPEHLQPLRRPDLEGIALYEEVGAQSEAHRPHDGRDAQPPGSGGARYARAFLSLL